MASRHVNICRMEYAHLCLLDDGTNFSSCATAAAAVPVAAGMRVDGVCAVCCSCSSIVSAALVRFNNLASFGSAPISSRAPRCAVSLSDTEGDKLLISSSTALTNFDMLSVDVNGCCNRL